VTGFLATIAIGNFRFRRLDASTGASDPNDFTVRCSPFVSRAAASTAPCPSFATMANASLARQDGGSYGFDLPDGASDLFLCEGLDRSLVICPSCYHVAGGARRFRLRVGQINRARRRTRNSRDSTQVPCAVLL
jgi:hypothetical protein